MPHPNFLTWELKEFLRQNAAHSTPLRAALSNVETASRSAPAGAAFGHVETAVRSTPTTRIAYRPRLKFRLKVKGRIFSLVIISVLIFLAVPIADASYRLVELRRSEEHTSELQSQFHL